VDFTEGWKRFGGPNEKNIRGMFSGMFLKKNKKCWSWIKNPVQKHTPENIPLKIKIMVFNIVGARPEQKTQRVWARVQHPYLQGTFVFLSDPDLGRYGCY
jgi:hypothetical protein